MSAIVFDVHLFRAQLASDAVGSKCLRGLVTNALVAEGDHVEVVAGAKPGRCLETDQLGAIRPGLAVVFRQV